MLEAQGQATTRQERPVTISAYYTHVIHAQKVEPNPTIRTPRQHVEHRHCSSGGGVCFAGSVNLYAPPEDTTLRSEAFLWPLGYGWWSPIEALRVIIRIVYVVCVEGQRINRQNQVLSASFLKKTSWMLTLNALYTLELLPDDLLLDIALLASSCLCSPQLLPSLPFTRVT